MTQYKKIFVDGIMHLGDMIMSASVFPILKKAYPQAEITYLAGGNLAFVAEMLEGVDRVIPYAYKSKGGHLAVYKLGKQLEKEHFDIGISLDPRERVTLMKWFANMPYTVSMEECLGWKLGWERWFYDLDLSFQQPWDFKEHLMSVSYQTLMRQFVGDKETAFYPPQLKASALEDLSYAQDLLKSNTTAKGLKIAFCFETTDKDKDWPTEKFSEVCNYLVKKYDAMLIMTGVEKQRTTVQKVVNGLQAKDHVLDVVGKTNFKQLVALCHSLDLVLTVDTGTAHIAAAAGCPVVTIFTHNSPKIYQAAGKYSAAVSGRLPCSGKGVCLDHVKCPKRDCVDAVTVAMVEQTIDALLEKIAKDK